MAQEQTMQAVTKYPSGTFSWVELATSDTVGAKAFYTSLFGWEYVDVPLPDDGVYTMFNLNGKSVSAMTDLQPHEREQGIPPHWNNYITVDDVDKRSAAAKAAGGNVLAEPFDVMEEGRMSIIQDPTGGVVMFWQARNHIGSSYVNYPNTFVWNELRSTDLDKAVEFYDTVLGWTTSVEESSSGSYTMFSNGERAAAGAMGVPEEWGDVPSHWHVYFRVENYAAAAKKAEELGGKIVYGPVEMPDMQMTFGGVEDPQGAMFTIMESENVDQPPEG